MGGFGSGRTYRYGSKQTVEDSFVLDLNFIFSYGLHPRQAFLSWHKGDNELASISYRIGELEDRPTLTLHYTFCGEEVVLPIPLFSKPQPYGGVRYWAECPLQVNSNCLKRCSKLYLPYGQRYFGCRNCHELTYKSCNTSHQFDEHYKNCVARFGPISRKQFNEEMAGKWYYKYFRTKKAARKWYAKTQK
ncbi:MAG TPA: hypothetical protein VFO76_10165 [Candidatus Kapabacteria bacterium]|nr:hypothetical protein [Candidatus Kapabacteria bacterium]